jgi:acetyltransferase-like isoleucine patch superfamily enzyme
MGGAMCAALRRSEPGPPDEPVGVAVAPPTAPPRAPGWRDRRRAARARRRARPGTLELPADIVLGRGVVFDVAAGARVVLGAGVALDDRCRFHVGSGAAVTIGAGSRLGERCVITAHERVTIGARCLLADEVVLTDAGARHDDVERPVREQGLSTAPVSVGDGVRVGPGAALLRGVTIGDRAAVGAHAVVTHDVAPGVAVQGVPAAPPPAPLSPRPPRPPRARGDRAPR